MAWLAPLLVGLLIGAIAGGAILALIGRARAARGEAEQEGLRRELDAAKLQADEKERQYKEADERLRDVSGRLHAEEARAARIPILEAQARELNEKLSQAQEQNASLRTSLEQERRSILEKQKLLDEAQLKLTDVFKSLATDVLNKNSESFLQLANENYAKARQAATGDLDKRQQAVQELVTPLRTQLERYEKQIQEMENLRQKAYGELLNQVQSLDKTQKTLEKETGNLVLALRAPKTRGRWGETTLRRAVELAGMIEYCDFIEQVSFVTDSGRQRPDMIIRLPNGRRIVVDAKAPLDAYLDHLNESDAGKRDQCIARHALAIKRHMESLSLKEYWKHLDPAPDFVVMFIPGEGFLSAAAQIEADLFEHGFRNNVIPATPATLISLLRTVALGWRQEQLAKNAEEISALGRLLYERFHILADHLVNLGASLKSSVDHYNSAITSLENRLLVTARKFPELGVRSEKKGDLPELTPIESVPLALTAPEMLSTSEVPGKTDSVCSVEETEFR